MSQTSKQRSGFGAPEGYYSPLKRGGIPADYVNYSGKEGIHQSLGPPNPHTKQVIPKKTLENFPPLPEPAAASQVKRPVRRAARSEPPTLQDVQCSIGTKEQPESVPYKQPPEQRIKTEGLEGLNIIVVENLPVTTQENTLKEFFESFGKVEECVLYNMLSSVGNSIVANVR